MITEAFASKVPEKCRARFLAKIDFGECWRWTGANSMGYGYFVFEQKHRRAHRLAYIWANGPIQEGLELDHLCRNRLCVRPEHLEAVTARENVRRGESFAGRYARQTHCKLGHPLSGDNVSKTRRGGRPCRTCKNKWSRSHPPSDATKARKAAARKRKREDRRGA